MRLSSLICMLRSIYNYYLTILQAFVLKINKKKENFAIWISNKRYLKNLDIFLRQTMLVPWTQFLFYIKMFTKNFNFIRISYY